MLCSSTAVGNQKKKILNSFPYGNNSREGSTDKVYYHLVSLHAAYNEVQLQVCYSHSVHSQDKFSSSHAGCGLFSVFHFMCVFPISFLRFSHVFVFFHICLHQVSHLHRVDLSTFAVADLQGIRKGTWSMTAAQENGREALSCPGESIPAQIPMGHSRVRKAENKFKSSIFLQAFQEWPRA